MSEINQEIRDRKYNNWARRNPAVVSIVFPLLAAVYYFQETTTNLNAVRYIVGVVLSFGSIIPALFFFYQSSIREISVLFVEKPLFAIFGRPAVNLMKKNNGILSTQRKERILKKANGAEIEMEFADGATISEYQHHYIIVREAFEKIRETCRDNSILFEFHCTYGFFRNLSGGLIVDLLLCAVLVYLNYRSGFGVGHLLAASAIILGALFVFCIICAYLSMVRYTKRTYVLYDDF